MGRAKQLIFWGLALVAAIALFEWTNLDLWVQDRLFNIETGQWLVDRNAALLRLAFYTGIKGAIIAFGVTLLALYGLTFSKNRAGEAGLSGLRRRYLIVILSVIVVPLTIAELKATTNIYCPSQIARYGGDRPYIKLFESYPADCNTCDSGRCFPAGHASGGFALMALYYLFEKKSHRLAGLGVGLGLGWAMGGYQMMKGAHFLSHTVVTMIAAWLMILCLSFCAQRVHPRSGV